MVTLTETYFLTPVAPSPLFIILKNLFLDPSKNANPAGPIPTRSYPVRHFAKHNITYHKHKNMLILKSSVE